MSTQRITDSALRRKLLTPWWVKDPLAWKAGEAGIAHLAMDGQVGKFNLCFWLLSSVHPVPEARYAATNLRWALIVAPSVSMAGATVEKHAATLTRTEFSKLVLAQRPAAKYEKFGMTFADLTKAAQFGVRHAELT